MTARIARALGIVCGPPLIPIALVVVVRAWSPRPLELIDLATFLVSLSLVPALLIYGAYRAGYVDDLGIPVREQRVLIATLAVASSAAGIVALLLLRAETTLVALATGILMQLVLLDLLTLRDKVSYHSAGTGGLAIAGLYLGGAGLGLPLGAVALATGWSRWYLGKHTLRQIATGFASSLSLGLWLFVISARLGLSP